MTEPFNLDPVTAASDASRDIGPERQPPAGGIPFRHDGAPAHPRTARLSRIEIETQNFRRPAGQSANRPFGRTNPGVYGMGIFSRTRDIVAANIADLLEKAEDPTKMIRMIIMEMEETLVEVRASAARTIADQKEMQRHVGKLERLQADWADKAALALSKDREDLARAALVEKNKAGGMAEELKGEIAVLDDALRAYEGDIDKLQSRLREARNRQGAIAARLESAENRVKLRTLLASERVDEAMARFEQLERRVDYAEGRADALRLAENGKPTLADEISALETADRVDAELAAMKQALSGGADRSGADRSVEG
jgi:phage shock protein A